LFNYTKHDNVERNQQVTSTRSKQSNEYNVFLAAKAGLEDLKATLMEAIKLC